MARSLTHVTEVGVAISLCGSTKAEDVVERSSFRGSGDRMQRTGQFHPMMPLDCRCSEEGYSEE